MSISSIEEFTFANNTSIGLKSGVSIQMNLTVEFSDGSIWTDVLSMDTWAGLKGALDFSSSAPEIMSVSPYG